MSQLTNYAGCQHCVDESILTKKDEVGESRRFYLVIFSLIFICVYVMFSMTSIPNGEMVIDFTKNISLTILYALIGIILLCIYAMRSDRNSLYLFYDQDGKMHAHRWNPIDERTTRSAWINCGKKWSPNPQMSSDIKHISGIVIRLRWRGWLFRTSGYNKIFENRGYGTNWRIDNHYMTDNGPTYTIGNRFLNQQHIAVKLSELLELTNSFSSLNQWQEYNLEIARDRHLLGESILAVVSYLQDTKRQGTSKVGQRARELLSASLSRLATGTDLALNDWNAKSEETLALLDKIISQQEQDKETKKVSA